MPRSLTSRQMRVIVVAGGMGLTAVVGNMCSLRTGWLQEKMRSEAGAAGRLVGAFEKKLFFQDTPWDCTLSIEGPLRLGQTDVENRRVTDLSAAKLDATD